MSPQGAFCCSAILISYALMGVHQQNNCTSLYFCRATFRRGRIEWLKKTSPKNRYMACRFRIDWTRRQRLKPIESAPLVGIVLPFFDFVPFPRRHIRGIIQIRVMWCSATRLRIRCSNENKLSNSGDSVYAGAHRGWILVPAPGNEPDRYDPLLFP